MKHVNVVSFFDDTLASFRLRQKVIGEHINDKSNKWRVSISARPDSKADINIFIKHKNKKVMLEWVDLLRQESSSKVIFDISDFHFDNPEHADFYKKMVKKADWVTCSSPFLSEYIREQFDYSKPCSTIFEPTQLEWVTNEDRWNKERSEGTVWLGSRTNLHTILPVLKDYPGTTIISDQEIKDFPFVRWYQGAEELLLKYKKALIPQPNKYKSPNRFVDAVIAGCEVETFGAECYNWLLDYRDRPESLKVMFSLDKISQDWEDVFDQVIELPKYQGESETSEPPNKVHPALEGKSFVKLNVGCGHKIYPKKEGWVNIDLIDNPDIDVRIDVRQISSTLGKNVADELHAYHVCEHIYPTELQAVLYDWMATLKPGGKLVVEMPDFIKCAKNILQIETTGDKSIWFELGLKGFYGDFDPKNPNVILDLHKNLYTFKTFEPILKQVGFVNIEEQTPLTHRQERDFRIVGYKPQ